VDNETVALSVSVNDPLREGQPEGLGVRVTGSVTVVLVPLK